MSFLIWLRNLLFDRYLLIKYSNYIDTSYGHNSNSHVLYYISPYTGKRKEEIHYDEGFLSKEEFKFMKDTHNKWYKKKDYERITNN